MLILGFWLPDFGLNNDAFGEVLGDLRFATDVLLRLSLKFVGDLKVIFELLEP